MLGLEDAEDSQLGGASNGFGPRAPARLVHAVVGLPEADVQRRGERRPAESIAPGEGLPCGGVAIPAIEHDEGLADRGDVACDRPRLCCGQVDRLIWRGVMLGEGCSACGEAPVLDGARGRELLARRLPCRRLIASRLQGSSELSHCGAVIARRTERIGRLLRNVRERERSRHSMACAHQTRTVCRNRRICWPAAARSGDEASARRRMMRC